MSRRRSRIALMVSVAGLRVSACSGGDSVTVAYALDDFGIERHRSPPSCRTGEGSPSPARQRPSSTTPYRPPKHRIRSRPPTSPMRPGTRPCRTPCRPPSPLEHRRWASVTSSTRRTPTRTPSPGHLGDVPALPTPRRHARVRLNPSDHSHGRSPPLDVADSLTGR